MNNCKYDSEISQKNGQNADLEDFDKFFSNLHKNSQLELETLEHKTSLISNSKN